MKGRNILDNATKKILSGFMIASLLFVSGCSEDVSAKDKDRDDDENSGVVTSTWDNDTRQWNHFRRYNGTDYYFGSSSSPHPATTTVVSPGVVSSVNKVPLSTMGAKGFASGVKSSVPSTSVSAKGGIGGGGARAVSAAS